MKHGDILPHANDGLFGPIVNIVITNSKIKNTISATMGIVGHLAVSDIITRYILYIGFRVKVYILYLMDFFLLAGTMANANIKLIYIYSN